MRSTLVPPHVASPPATQHHSRSPLHVNQGTLDISRSGPDTLAGLGSCGLPNATHSSRCTATNDDDRTAPILPPDTPEVRLQLGKGSRDLQRNQYRQCPTPDVRVSAVRWPAEIRQHLGRSHAWRWSGTPQGGRIGLSNQGRCLGIDPASISDDRSCGKFTPESVLEMRHAKGRPEIPSDAHVRTRQCVCGCDLVTVGQSRYAGPACRQRTSRRSRRNVIAQSAGQ